MNRQRLILFILVILFGCAVVWSYSAMPKAKTVSTLTFTPGQQRKPVAAAAVRTPTTVETKPANAAVDDGTTLKLGLLEQKTDGFKGYRRNLFKPVFVDETKIVTKKVVAPPPPVKVAPVKPAEPVKAQPESAPLARFTFLGFLKKGSARTIFLEKDKEIILVKKGDKIAGRYEATDITDQSLRLTVSDTGDVIVIPLLENRPLNAAR